MDWTPVLDFLNTLAPWIKYIFMALGTIVVVGTGVDSMIPDEKDREIAMRQMGGLGSLS